MKLLVIGGSGLVGSNVCELATDQGWDVHGSYRNAPADHTDIELDKTNVERTSEVIQDIRPDAVFDTAAFHAVDSCKTERERAWNVNATGTRNAAVAANDVGAHYLYLSTDYVFPGNPVEAPYAESDPVAPPNYYARTKYAAEQAAQIAETVTVLRPSVIYGVASENFATWALGELEAGNEMGIVDDQTSRPTYAPDLAGACLEIADRELTGLYHATGPESLSRYEFTFMLAEVGGYDTDLISRISTKELGQEAPRPADSSLDSSRLYDAIEEEFRHPARAFEELCKRWEGTG